MTQAITKGFVKMDGSIRGIPTVAVVLMVMIMSITAIVVTGNEIPNEIKSGFAIALGAAFGVPVGYHAARNGGPPHAK